MYRRKELMFILLVQAAVTLVMSSATPEKGIVHPGFEKPYTHPAPETLVETDLNAEALEDADLLVSSRKYAFAN